MFIHRENAMKAQHMSYGSIQRDHFKKKQFKNKI